MADFLSSLGNTITGGIQAITGAGGQQEAASQNLLAQQQIAQQQQIAAAQNKGNTGYFQSGTTNTGPYLPNYVAPPPQQQQQQKPSAPSNTGLDPHINPATGQWDDNYYASNNKASTPSIDMAGITAAYDQMRNTMEGMKGVYGDTYRNAQQYANQGLENQMSQIEQSKGTMGEQNRQAQGSLYNNLLENQAQNRGVARAFGGMSSGFEQGNTRLQQGYSTNAANLSNDFAGRIKQLDLAGVQAKQDHQKMLNDAKTQYEQGLYQIALNQNQTDLQKAQSLQQAKQDFDNKVYQSQQQLKQFQQSLEAMKLQSELYKNQYGAATTGYNPLAQVPTVTQPYGYTGNTQQAAGGLTDAYKKTANNNQGYYA